MDRSEEHLKANTERWLTKHSSSIAHSLEPPPSQSQKENGDSPRSRDTGNARRLRLPRRLPLEHSGHLRQILGALHDAANTRAGKTLQCLTQGRVSKDLRGKGGGTGRSSSAPSHREAWTSAKSAVSSAVAQWQITRRRTRGVPPSPPADSGRPECRAEAASGDMHGILRAQAHPMQPDEPDMVLKLHQAICMAHCVCRPIPRNHEPDMVPWSDSLRGLQASLGRTGDRSGSAVTER